MGRQGQHIQGTDTCKCTRCKQVHHLDMLLLCPPGGVPCFGNDWRSCWDKARPTSDDSVNGVVLSSVDDVFILSFPIVICEEVLIDNSVDIGVTRGFDRGLGEAAFMSFSVNRERAKELPGLIEGFFDGEGSFDPVDCWVDFFQPGKS